MFLLKENKGTIFSKKSDLTRENPDSSKTVFFR